MDLFLIRHAAAAEGALYGEDGERPLTAEGRQSVLAVGGSLAQNGVKLDLIVASPLVRAVETAELIAVSIGYEGELQICRELAPEGSPAPMIERALRPNVKKSRVALVGHLPSMGNLLGALLGRPGVTMSKMSVVRLGWADGRPAKLVWVITPRRLDPVASLDGV
jgi:phosphohistidine phosphatase